jgi:ubiquinone/menaquinone biosynthesis C-methylase UbiE
VPDATDFYAPVTSLFRADPTRTDEPALASLLALVEPGDTWLDIGAGAGRYALPIARAVASTGGEVIAVDPSSGMLAGLHEIATEFPYALYSAASMRGSLSHLTIWFRLRVPPRKRARMAFRGARGGCG